MKWLLLLLVFLAGCDETPRPGSAQSLAATVEDAATLLTAAAANADIQAAKSTGEAAAAEAIFAQTKTKEAEAAVIAAKAKMQSDVAAAAALNDACDKATKKSEKADKAAADERIKQQKVDEQLWWKRITEIVGAICIGAGAIIGGIICYTTKSMKTGVPVGGIIASAGLAVAVYGVMSPWMLLGLGALVAGGLGIWLFIHVDHVHTTNRVRDEAEGLKTKVQGMEGDAEARFLEIEDRLKSLTKANP